MIIMKTLLTFSKLTTASSINYDCNDRLKPLQEVS